MTTLVDFVVGTGAHNLKIALAVILFVSVFMVYQFTSQKRTPEQSRQNKAVLKNLSMNVGSWESAPDMNLNVAVSRDDSTASPITSHFSKWIHNALITLSRAGRTLGAFQVRWFANNHNSADDAISVFHNPIISRIG